MWVVRCFFAIGGRSLNIGDGDGDGRLILNVTRIGILLSICDFRFSLIAGGSKVIVGKPL
jgi:hypothetical protein